MKQFWKRHEYFIVSITALHVFVLVACVSGAFMSGVPFWAALYATLRLLSIPAALSVLGYLFSLLGRPNP